MLDALIVVHANGKALKRGRMPSTSSIISLTSKDGHRYSTWFCPPKGTPKGGIIILHSIYGMTAHMGDVCARWAEEGYAALAPALFDRTMGPNEFSYDRSGANAGIEAYAALSENNVFLDLETAKDTLLNFGKVAISGFCTGGSWAWRAASKMHFDAQVNFYGSHIHDLIDLKPHCPTILHYGDRDHIMPLAKIEAIHRRHPDVDLQIYKDVGHAFFNPDQTTFEQKAADIAWKKSCAFMQFHLAR